MSDLNTVIVDASPGGVATVMIDRPEKHNAFNALVVEQLTDAFETVRTSNCRTLILRGAGKSFSAGGDLEWMRAAGHYTKAENETDALGLAHMLKKLAELPMLTIASVQGACMGGGCGLVAACDVAVARTDANFRFSEVRLGLIPAAISPYVIRAIGPRWANALFVTGEGFNGEYAEKMGLVHYTVKDETEMEDMLEYLTKLAFQTAPGAVAASKKLMAEVTGKPITDDLIHMTAKRIAALRASEEGKEGLSAFLEKRKPNWAE
jgi:methylglutaconyl-CoA hydratase